MTKIKEAPKRTYHTAWFFADHANLDKLLYDTVHGYLQEGKYSQYKELWAKFCALGYLGGYRRIELFLSRPTIITEQDRNKDFYHLTKVNAKHFKHWQAVGTKQNGKTIYKGVGERERIPLVFTPANKYEAALWKFIAPHERETLDFSPLINEQLTWKSLANVSKMFSMRFRAKITNGEKVEENGGITPHMLRHARVYDMHINERYPDFMVMKIMGWGKRDMIDWYEDIKTALTTQELKDIYFQHLEQDAKLNASG